MRDKFTTPLVLAERKISCATVEGLLAMKLYALPSLYAQGNTEKIARYEKDLVYLLNADRKADIKCSLAAVEPYVSRNQMQELKNIVADIERTQNQQQERIQRLKL